MWIITGQCFSGSNGVNVFYNTSRRLSLGPTFSFGSLSVAATTLAEMLKMLAGL